MKTSGVAARRGRDIFLRGMQGSEQESFAVPFGRVGPYNIVPMHCVG
jgi:hypothetical protein